MPRIRTFALLVFLTGTLCAAGKDKDKSKDKPEDWLPITQQDLSIKDVPNDPGANAIQLYMSYYKDEDAGFVFVYKRIKTVAALCYLPGEIYGEAGILMVYCKSLLAQSPR